MLAATPTLSRSFLFAALAGVGCAGWFFAGGMAGAPASADEAADALGGKALVIPIRTDDLDDTSRFRDLQELLARAKEEGAAAVVFEINTRGGGASLEAHQRLLEDLPGLDMKTFAYVNPTALGAGALMALGTDAIYMAPASIIGGSGVQLDSEKSDEAQKRRLAQELSVLKARARSLANAKGHDPRVAEAFIDSELELVIGEEELSPRGELLTLTAEEATRQIEGKPVLAKGLADSPAGLLEAEGITAPVLVLSPRDHASGRARARLSRPPAAAAVEGEEGARRLSAEPGSEAALYGKRDQISYAGKVVRLEVGESDLISGKARFEFMDRTLRKAKLDGASAVIFDIDTPGGYAWYTKGLLLNSLQAAGVPTIAFVNTRAESAGAILAVGTDAIYMRPAASIGSALVVSGTGADIPEALDDKITQMAIAAVRNMAELKGHNPDVAEAFVTREKEVRIDGIVVHASGNVLNLNTIDATRVVGGRPVLAKGVADSIEDIVAQERLEGEIIDAKPYGMEALAQWVQRFSFVLIILGLGGAYLELQSPGFGAPGIAALLAFGMFFFGNYAAGNLAGYELAVLLVVGLLLVGVEIFVLPGAVIPGLVGAVLVLASLGMAMVDRVDFTYAWKGLPGAGSWTSILSSAALSLAFGLIGAVALILLAMRYLPDTRAASWLILRTAIPVGASLEVESDPGAPAEAGRPVSYVGLSGRTSTDLRPAGKGEFGGLHLDIISDGQFLEKGSPVRVVKHEGSRIVVRAERGGAGAGAA